MTHTTHMQHTHPLRTEATIARDHVRTIVAVRWLGVAFALVQVFSYQTLPYPPGIREAAIGLVAIMAATNVAFEVARRRVTTSEEVRLLSLAILVVDVLTLSGLTWLYAFDSLSALFAILFLLPIEAAVLFGLPGALWTWVAVGVLYVGREWFGMRYGNPFELESVTFRLGLIGIVALIVGLLVRDLVAWRSATAAALREARRAEESRTRLISMLAHDVRAPIAAARSAFDTLHVAGDRLEASRRDDVVRAGRRQADRALLLARDLLDLARVEAGTLVVEEEVVRLADVVDRVEEVLTGPEPVQVDLDGLHVRADAARLEQVLFNLLDNATKHGEPPVELAARRDRGEVVLVVRDHGPGVSAEVDLFAPFSHAGEGSVGLGMWIVRQLVEAMDGTVDHEPADPGARFVVRLPGAQPDVADSSSANGTTSPLSRS